MTQKCKILKLRGFAHLDIYFKNSLGIRSEQWRWIFSVWGCRSKMRQDQGIIFYSGRHGQLYLKFTKIELCMIKLSLLTFMTMSIKFLATYWFEINGVFLDSSALFQWLHNVQVQFILKNNSWFIVTTVSNKKTHIAAF